MKVEENIMNDNMLKRIYDNMEKNSQKKISFDELVKIIKKTEANLGYELSGYGKKDVPYRQFYSKDALNVVIPKEKISILVLEQALKYKNNIAYKCGRKITYNEVYEKIIATAKSLKALGILEGDFITMCVPSVPEAIYIFFAANLIGAVTRPIDPISSPNQIKENVMATNSKMLVTMDLNYSKCKDLFNNTDLKNILALSINSSLPKGLNIEKIVVNFGTFYSKLIMAKKSVDSEKWLNFYDFIKIGENSKYNDLSVEDLRAEYVGNQTFSVLSTSGSTGEPRGVCITDENIISSIYKQLASNFLITGDDSLFNPMPTCSSYFWDDVVLAFFYGVTTTLSPLFNAEKSAKEIVKAGCSINLAGPILLEKLNDYIEFRKKANKPLSLAFIKHIISGGDLLVLELEEKTNRNLRLCGSEAIIENALGTSETCGASLNPNGMMADRTSYCEGSVGVVLAGDDVAIFKYDVENDKRNIADKGYDEGLTYYEIGEICLNCNNGNVFKEYFNNPTATNNTKLVHNDGTVWYHTGDLGFMDPEGRIFCSCRKTGLIVRDGHKIWAPKLENLVKLFNDINDCAVIGVPDLKDKEAPVIFVEFVKSEKIDKELIKKQILEKISLDLDDHHLPLEIIEIDKIPRNLMLKTKIGELLNLYNQKYLQS